ncbi:MAG: hypothetical protein C0481_11610 [Phenylobacterium sp.]|uniref:hypothetical protein n=1 Tax=Phenylobacterium sp. TaxID=1871053 RepID=UPI0025D06359|nr:hypothetical protein [Phenylobacterium sp.]MBA4012504.1 hypothetical protein [Phenylobacterium sp.]
MILLSIALLQAAAAGGGDPLAPARSDQVQCYGPDATRRECVSIGAYHRSPDGGVLNEAIVLITPDPRIIMTTVAPVQVKDGAICGAMQPAHLAASTFTVADAPATPEQTAALRQELAKAMQPLFGKEICTSITTTPDGASIGQARVDGVRQPAMDQPVIWVPKAAGWKIRTN